jgi:hypothetical protein
VEHESSHRYAPKVGRFTEQRHATYGETAIAVYRQMDTIEDGIENLLKQVSERQDKLEGKTEDKESSL